MAKKISGSEIVIECLKEQGVDIVFGYPGGAILNAMMLYISIRKRSRMYLHHMSRGQHMPLTDMQEQQVRSVSVWLHPVLVQQTL